MLEEVGWSERGGMEIAEELTLEQTPKEALWMSNEGSSRQRK